MRPSQPLMVLNSEQVEQFFEVGFIVLHQLFSASSIAKMRSAFDDLEQLAHSLSTRELNPQYSGSSFVLGGTSNQKSIQRIVWCGGAAPLLKTVGNASVLPAIAADLLGSSRMDHLINQAHFKNPNDGVEFPWHQDSTHRRYGTEWVDLNGKGSYVQTALAIDDHTLENGPLKFIPGSTKLGHLGLEQEHVHLEDHVDLSNAVSLQMKAGSVVVFSPYVIHSSTPNLSQTPRRTLINGYAYPGANQRIYPGSGLGISITANPAFQKKMRDGNVA